MFNNQKYNVIILADFTDTIMFSKTVGPYKVAHELRLAGYEVAVIHHLHGFSYNELIDALSKIVNEKTLFIGFNTFFMKKMPGLINVDTHFTYDPKEPGMMLPHGRAYNKNFKDQLRKLNPNLKFVLGGPDANDVEYNKDFDYQVIGYGDQSMINLANHLAHGEKLQKSLKSIFGPIIINDSKAENFDFVNSTLEYKPYDAVLPGETLVIEISRGCIFRCDFCSYPLNGKKKLDYLKNEELLYKEFLRNYEQFGVSRYMFSDDTFNDSTEKVDMMLRISKRLPFKLEYWAYIRLDLLGARIEMLPKLYESGLRSAFFGIETFNYKTGSAIGKGQKKETQIETLWYIKKHYPDIHMDGSFIFGLPHESVESCKETAKFLLSDESPLDSFNVSPFWLAAEPKILAGFTSLIESNLGKYGYRVKGKRNNFLIWENDHMDFFQAEKMANEIEELGFANGKKKTCGQVTYMQAGIGVSVDFIRQMNADTTSKNWKKVILLKLKRLKEYKSKLYKELGIDVKNIPSGSSR